MATAFRTDWDTEPNPRYDVWTVTNGGEILPGVLTPFIATLYNEIDAKGLRELMKAYPTGKRVSLYKPPIGNFFGITAGRLALNVGFSVAAMSCLDPDIATAMAAQFFQGSDEALRLIVQAPADEVAEALAVATAQREAAEAESRRDQAALYGERISDRAASDRALPLKAAWKRLHELLDDTGVLLNRHLMVSTAAGEMQVRLAGVIAAGGGDLAQVARKSAAVRRVLAAGDTAAALAAMAANDPAWGAFIDEFDEFVHRFGFRVQGEADPSVPDWGEEPTFLLSQVKSMMALKPADSPAAHVKRAGASRVKLERAVRASLAAEFRPHFDAALAQAQRFTAMRELTKAVWVLGTRRMRAPLLAVCDGLVASGAVKQSGDALYLTYREVEAAVKGKTVADAAAIVRRRKQQRAKAAEYTLPDAWVGTVAPQKQGAVRKTKRLAGVGVSAGVATGRARIILNTEAAFARDIEPGDVLVAPFTDTPWTPLFIPAAAVVVETGGMLSHAATVAREFGIPCVVLVKDATRIIAEGQTVTVDGAAGTVEIGQAGAATRP
jgi:phosphohistidine swiveling domain-containing protein